jgi:membrane protein implicated in regulation of membrane protease activity
MAGASAPVQIVVFFAVSIVLLIFTRPILVKRLKVGKEKNYTENLEEKIGLVTEDIKPFHSGLVKVNGIIWTAVGETNEMELPVGAEAMILRVEGVKLIVRPMPGARTNAQSPDVYRQAPPPGAPPPNVPMPGTLPNARAPDAYHQAPPPGV